jgi:hypothetical protein
MRKVLALIGLVVGRLLEPFGIGIPIGLAACEELERQERRSNQSE